MEFFKNIWLKIVTCIFCIQDQEISEQYTTNKPKSENEKKEQMNHYQEFIEFQEIMKSKIKKSKLTEKRKKEFLDFHERTDELSKLLLKYFRIQNDDETFSREHSRMFHGALSSKVQGELFLAIEASNHLAIEKSLDNGAQINQKINGLDPLQYAISQGKDYIIEFLLEKGALIKPYHIELAESYEYIYESNINDNDMKFKHGNSQKTIQEMAREYHMIADLLHQEMILRAIKKEKEAAQQTTSNSQKPTTTISRPKIVTFTEGQNDDE